MSRETVAARQRIRALETKLGPIVKSSRLLPALTASNAVRERLRLRRALEAGVAVVPKFEYPKPRTGLLRARELDCLRQQARELPGATLYEAKLDELEIDVALLSALGDARRIRPLAARRFGTGDERVATPDGERRLCDYARSLIVVHRPPEEPRTLPALTRDGTPCLAALIHQVAARAGLDVDVRVEPNLAAGAATGDRTVYIADRRFGVREAVRLAVHEVLGHLTAAANGRAQPIRLPEWGTAGAFADQEGVALCVEEAFGVLDLGRLCALAGRVLAASSMHAGASFGDTARTLYLEHGFTSLEAVSISERAYRGGGVARDAGYLLGYLRVRAAIERGEATLDELRMGRVGLAALPALRELIAQGLSRPASFRPHFASFFSSSAQTPPWTPPLGPAFASMSVELT